MGGFSFGTFLILFSIFGLQNFAFAVNNGTPAKSDSPELSSTVWIVGQPHKESEDGELCTGVFIREDYVLTAAHCFYSDDDSKRDSKDLYAYIKIINEKGEVVEKLESNQIFLYPKAVEEQIALAPLRAATISELNDAQTFDAYIKASQGYKRNFAIHDLAVVQLPKHFSAPHAVVSVYTGALKAGDELSFAGYGDTNYNQDENPVKALSLAKMKVLSAQENGYFITGTDGSRVMTGDSGGPMYVKKDKKLYLAAINVSSYIEFSKNDWENKNFDPMNATGYSVSMNLNQFSEFLKPFLAK